MKKDIIDIPKIVLHLHLDGSINIDLAYKWLLEDGYNYTKEEAEDKLQVNSDCKSLVEYLEKFDLPCKLLNSKERLTLCTKRLFLDLAKENVVYAEVRFAPVKHVNDNLSLEEVVTSVIEGMNLAKKESSIRGGIILCCMRDNSKEDNLKTIDMAKKYLNKGICAVDLAGAESLFPTANFKDVFEYANSLNIPFTIHAGEADGIKSIESALSFGTKRLGHGIRCIDSNEMVERIKKENILLEVCYTSNYQTEAIKDIHPLEELYYKGVKISLNTDNDTVSHINILSEYEKILNNTNLKIEDIVKCNYNSIDFIFSSDEDKNYLKDKINKFKGSM